MKVGMLFIAVLTGSFFAGKTRINEKTF